MKRANADGIHIGAEEAAEADNQQVGEGTPDTAPFRDIEVEAEVEHVTDDERPAEVELADGLADDGDDEAVDAPEAGAPDGSE